MFKFPLVEPSKETILKPVDSFENDLKEWVDKMKTMSKYDMMSHLIDNFHDEFGRDGLTFTGSAYGKSPLKKLVELATIKTGDALFDNPEFPFYTLDVENTDLALSCMIDTDMNVVDNYIVVADSHIEIRKPQAAIFKAVLMLFMNLEKSGHPMYTLSGYHSILMFLERWLQLGRRSFMSMNVYDCDEKLQSVRVIYKTDADGVQQVYMAYLLPDDPARYPDGSNLMMVYSLNNHLKWVWAGFFAPSLPGEACFSESLELTDATGRTYAVDYDDVIDHMQDIRGNYFEPSSLLPEDDDWEELVVEYVSYGLKAAADAKFLENSVASRPSTGNSDPHSHELFPLAFFERAAAEETAAAGGATAGGAAAEDNAAAEKADRKAASMKAAERVATEIAAAKKATAERVAAEKAAATVAAAAKAAAEKAAAEKAATEATTEEKAAAGGGATAEENPAVEATASRTQPRLSAGHSGGGVAGCKRLYRALERVATAGEAELAIPEQIDPLSFVGKAVLRSYEESFKRMKRETHNELMGLLSRPPPSEEVLQHRETLDHLKGELETVEALGLDHMVPELPGTIANTERNLKAATLRDDAAYEEGAVAAAQTIYASFQAQCLALKNEHEGKLAEAVAFANKRAKTSDA